MKICIPVTRNEGIDSEVSEHFGSAPFFMIINTDNLQIETITNNNQHHEHGMCQPLKVLGHHQYDAIVVGGIGAGALNKLKAAGIKVYKSKANRVIAVLEGVKKNELEEVNPHTVCQGH